MTYRSDLYIDGQWTAGTSGESIPVRDPATGSILADFAVATEQDCLRSVAAAEEALPAWSAAAPRERAEILRTCFEILSAEQGRLVDLIVAENGKAHQDAVAEAAYATEFFRWFSEEAVRVGGEYRRAPSGDKDILVTHEPVGVSLLITPWNFPAAMATRKLAPALAAGCTTILKPASETPLTAAYVVEALERAGVPAGVVNLVLPRRTGPAMARILQEPAVRKLSFTGSTEVGRILLGAAADTVISTSMELGGNAPFVVLPGADIEAAVEGAMTAKMRNGGAACTAANRIYVHQSQAEAFTTALIAAMEAVQTGPGRDPSNSLGAFVSTDERDKVADLVDRAVIAGAVLRTGGTASEHGAFYAPTVLDRVEHGAEVTHHEIFGPVAAVITYDEVDDAVRMANDTEYGLIAYVYGPLQDALGVARRIEAGMVAVNRGVASDPAAPFGGVKQSGIGREGGFAGIYEFLESKYIAVDAIE